MCILWTSNDAVSILHVLYIHPMDFLYTCCLRLVYNLYTTCTHFVFVLHKFGKCVVPIVRTCYFRVWDMFGTCSGKWGGQSINFVLFKAIGWEVHCAYGSGVNKHFSYKADSCSYWDLVIPKENHVLDKLAKHCYICSIHRGARHEIT